jgi:hypothetical protein
MGEWKTGKLTEQMIEALEALWATGLSCSGMAPAFRRQFPEYEGDTSSSSCIAGVVWRLRKKGYNFPERPKVAVGYARHRNDRVTRAHRSKEQIAAGYAPKYKKNGQSKKKANTPTLEPRYSARGAGLLPGDGIPRSPLATFAASWVAPEGSQPKTLFELADDECRWPVEVDGTQLYCANKGAPYCTQHKKAMHR